METRNWSEERMGRLQELYSEGRSFSLIAADIGVSRSAAIGKARRMQLPRRIEITQCKPRPGDENVKRRRAVKPTEPEPEPEVEIIPGHDYRCRIDQLEANTCRYPLWSMTTAPHERLYCGCPGASVSAGRPYCREHTALCETPTQG